MLVLVFALLTSAHAASVRFCLYYNVDIDDAEGVGDDYMNNNATNYPARGSQARVKETVSGAAIWTGNLAEAGANVGCTPALTLTHGTTYTITSKSEAVLRGNNLYLYDAPGVTPSEYVAIPSTTYNPPVGGETKSFTISTQDHWSNMAIAEWTIWHADSGPMDLINLYMSGCGSGVDGTCCNVDSISGDSEVYANGYARKALLAHFLGHCVWTASGLPQMATTHSDLFDGDFTPCNYDGGYPHNILTREFQAANIWEGWASFYWANAFNDGNEWAEDDECFINHYEPDSLDWNADGTVSLTESDPIVSCAGSTNVEDESDYFWDYCDGDSNPFDMTDENVNTGTELDWTRHFWDFAWEFFPDQMGADDVLALITVSNPAGWNITGHATGAGNPYEDMDAAAWASSDGNWVFSWGAIDYNGIEQ